MRRLTKREQTIMRLFWEKGPMFVKDLQACYPEPAPHINTLSTQVRHLEEDGFLKHNSYGKSFQYLPAMDEKYYAEHSLEGLVKNYYADSYLDVVSGFLRDEKISVEELKAIIAKVEEGQ